MAMTIPMNDKNLIIHGNDCDNDFDVDYDDELVIHSMITDKSPNNTYQVLISNNSDQYLEFLENSPIATMQEEKSLDIYSIHHISTVDNSTQYTFNNEHDFTSNLVITNVSGEKSSMDDDDQCLFFNDNTVRADLHHSNLEPPDALNPEHMTCRNLNEVSTKSNTQQRQKAIGEFKQRINSDNTMNQTEKKAALDQFINKGYATKSCTSVIESNTHVTELKESNEVLTEKEILAKIQLDHLQPDEKAKALELFKKYIGVFAKHEYDCPPNNLGVVADVQLAEDFCPSKTVNCKYFPIPPQIRPQVKNILRKMQENGIITDCTEYSPIVSNLLIGKKKSINGVIKARVLVDCRAINFFFTQIANHAYKYARNFCQFFKENSYFQLRHKQRFFHNPY